MLQWKILERAMSLSFVLLLLTVSIYAQSSSPNYSMSTVVVAMGGGNGNSTNFQGQHSVGQPTVIGNLQSPGYTMYAGFIPAVIEGFVPSAAERGDVNGDMSINVLDVLAVVNDILGTVPLSGDALLRADCNGDGDINVLDALGIVNVILSVNPDCPGGGAKPEVTSDALEFLKGLEPYFPAEDFASFMALVRETVGIPTEFTLGQNYPNPFNPTTDIRYQIPDGRYPVHTTLKVYNILGQEMRTLVDEYKGAGYYTVSWDGTDSQGRRVPSGIYFYRMSADSGRWSETRRMVLMK